VHAAGRAASAPKPVKGARAPRRDPSQVKAPPPARLVGYARVSTDDQTNALQADAMAQANVDVVFHEEASGVNTARPVLADTLASLHGSIGWGGR
jgi:predicted site-specific integrase-resolvase